MGSTPAEILINNFLKLAEENELMPWQCPYNMHRSMNYMSMQGYSGFNSLILPPGEYLTRNQINEYNEKNGEDFRFQKGIQWFPISFYKKDVKSLSNSELEELKDKGVTIPQLSEGMETFFKDGFWTYYVENFKYRKCRVVLQWYKVTERCYLMNSKGEFLPSRFEYNAVEIVQETPQKVIDNYLSREGIKTTTWSGTPVYNLSMDIIKMNVEHNSESEYFCSLFHELAHSTGHKSRLDRNLSSIRSLEDSAKEECIAEITASMLCGETGIEEFKTSHSKEFKNSASYFNFYYKKIKDWGKEFIYIVSSAEKAFNYIMGY